MSQKLNSTLQKKTQDFQKILKSERAQRGWSQADVAERIGSDPKTVGRWERGITFPSLYMCQQLSELYGKSLQELGLIRDKTLLPASGNVESESGQSPAAEEVQTTPPVRPRSRRMSFVLSLLIVFLLLTSTGILWWLLHRPVPAPELAANPYASTGTLALNNTLAADSAAEWSLISNAQGRCSFAQGSYHISDVAKGFMEVCLANETDFVNFTYEVKMTIIEGDCGGLAFRVTFPQLYYFLGCSDGHYRFVRYDRNDPANVRIVAQGISSAIHRGLHVANVLAVVAVKDTFKIYMNHKLIAQDTDDAYLAGQVGLMAHTCRITSYSTYQPDLCDVTEASFTNARIWKM